MGGANAAFANRGAMSRGGMGGGFGGAGMRGGGGFGGGRGGGGRGGGFGGGGRGGGRGGGGRRSDMRLKHDIVLLGRLDDGLGYYRFVYNGGHTAYVGVMAQEVRAVAPDAVTLGADGYMRVSYDRLDCGSRPTASGWRAARICRVRNRPRIDGAPPGSRHARAIGKGNRTRTTTMTMRIGGILAAAVLIAAAFPAFAQETYPTPEAAVKDLVDSAKAKTLASATAFSARRARRC